MSDTSNFRITSGAWTRAEVLRIQDTIPRPYEGHYSRDGERWCIIHNAPQEVFQEAVQRALDIEAMKARYRKIDPNNWNGDLPAFLRARDITL